MKVKLREHKVTGEHPSSRACHRADGAGYVAGQTRELQEIENKITNIPRAIEDGWSHGETPGVDVRWRPANYTASD
jgi:hypothetical protein